MKTIILTDGLGVCFSVMFWHLNQQDVRLKSSLGDSLLTVRMIVTKELGIVFFNIFQLHKLGSIEITGFYPSQGSESELHNSSTTTGLDGRVEIWIFLSQDSTSRPSFFLFNFSISMPVWHHLCIWLDSSAMITAYLDGWQATELISLEALDQTASTEVVQIWTNMETFR